LSGADFCTKFIFEKDNWNLYSRVDAFKALTINKDIFADIIGKYILNDAKEINITIITIFHQIEIKMKEKNFVFKVFFTCVLLSSKTLLSSKINLFDFLFQFLHFQDSIIMTSS